MKGYITKLNSNKIEYIILISIIYKMDNILDNNYKMGDILINNYKKIEDKFSIKEIIYNNILIDLYYYKINKKINFDKYLDEKNLELIQNIENEKLFELYNLMVRIKFNHDLKLYISKYIFNIYSPVQRIKSFIFFDIYFDDISEYNKILTQSIKTFGNYKIKNKVLELIAYLDPKFIIFTEKSENLDFLETINLLKFNIEDLNINIFDTYNPNYKHNEIYQVNNYKLIIKSNEIINLYHQNKNVEYQISNIKFINLIKYIIKIVDDENIKYLQKIIYLVRYCLSKNIDIYNNIIKNKILTQKIFEFNNFFIINNLENIFLKYPENIISKIFSHNNNYLFEYFYNKYPNIINKTIDNNPFLLKYDNNSYFSKYFNYEYYFIDNLRITFFDYNLGNYVRTNKMLKNSKKIYQNFETNNFYFIGIPKNGSQSVLMDKVLYPCHIKTYFGHAMAKDFPKDVNLFTICRNPITRAYSAYNFVSRGGHYQNLEYLLIKNLFPTFDFWILYGISKYFIDNSFYGWNEPFIKQSLYVCDENNNKIIDNKNILYFEDYENNILNFMEENDFSCLNSNNIKFKHFNKSKTQAELDNVNKNVKNKIYELYEDDFNLFNYKI